MSIREIDSSEYAKLQKTFYHTRSGTGIKKGSDIHGDYVMLNVSRKEPGWTSSKGITGLKTIPVKLIPPAYIIDLKAEERSLQAEVRGLASRAVNIVNSCSAISVITPQDRDEVQLLSSEMETKSVLLQKVQQHLEQYHSERDAELLSLQTSILKLRAAQAVLGKEKANAFTVDNEKYNHICEDYFKNNSKIIEIDAHIDKIQQEVEQLDEFVVAEPAKLVSVTTARLLTDAPLVARKH